MQTDQIRCYNCFQHIEDPSQPCPYCGFDLNDNVQKFPVALRAGTVLNSRYIVGRVLGQGGFGITYVAFDTQLQARVAIKEYMPSEMATRVEGTTVSIMMDTRAEDFVYGAERFQEEARTLAKFIGHPNIAGVSSYFDENDTSYFVMDYIEGVSFKSYIANNGGKVSVDETLNVMIPVLRALTAVHAEGFIHRDVTPDNIYISKDGNVKLLDFGSARYSIGDKSKSLDVILKVGYAPKEQYIRWGRQGPYTDVYSCAACFYAALTGFLPPESLERMDQDTLVPVSQCGIDIPDWLDRAILKGLAVQPEDRFQSAAEFLDAIENQLLVEVPVAGGVPAPVPARKKPLGLIIGAVAALLVLAVGIGVFVGNRGGDIPGVPDSSSTGEDRAPLKRAEVPYITIRGEQYSTDLRKLDLENMGLTDEEIVDLKYMINLTQLRLPGNDITDLSPIAGLTELRYIDLRENTSLEDFSPLAGLTSLEQINYYNTAIQDYSFLAGMTGLKTLEFYNVSAEADLSCLSGLTNVTQIYCNGGRNQINDLGFLRGMTKLTQLHLQLGSDIEEIDLSLVAGLTELTELNLYCNGQSSVVVRDISPLAGLTKLQILQLPADVESLAPLAGMTDLKNLSLAVNGNNNEYSDLTDISALANMPKLTSLSLSLGDVQDLSPLQNLTKLTELYLYGNFTAKDFTFLQNAVKLQTLNFNPYNDGSQIGLDSFRGLEKLTELRDLGIYCVASDSCTSTAPLAGLTKLTTLVLPYNYNYDDKTYAIDLSGLSGLTKLQDLTVNGRAASLEPLRGLTGLRSLRMYNAADWQHPLQSLEVFSGLENLRSLNIGLVAEGTDTSPVSHVTDLNINYR